MQERNTQFSLDLEKFRDILSQQNWFKLQHDFRTKRVQLSQSLLIWNEEPGSTWSLVDFGNQKTYHIAHRQDTAGTSIVQVSDLSDGDEQLVPLDNSEAARSRLQRDPQTGQVPQGTHEGFIDLLRKLDLNEINLEELKRANLAGSGLSFESVHLDLSVVREMFHDILTSPREHLINLSHGEVQTVKGHLLEFYKKTQEIEDFDISVENPSETHANLLQEISNFCSTVKQSLSQTTTYLKSKQMERLEYQIKDTVTAAEKNFNSEVNRAKEINEETETKEAERQKVFDRLKVELENQLGKKLVSSYEKIFADQAEEHRKGAQFWLRGTVVLTIGFGLIFWWLITDLVPAGSEAPMILQNLFTKGFFLSLIYLLLNRSIKSYAAEKHLQTVNRHRQNALATFNAFFETAGENQETRNAVLLAATDAIFDANQSGYLSAKTSRSDSAGLIQQVIRAVTLGKSIGSRD